MQKIKENRHITEEMWIALENDTILSEQFMQVLEHTCDCTWCADRLATMMEPHDTTVMPPSYLQEEILERTRQLDVQTAVVVKQTSKRLQLFFYSLRVGAAVLVSILILGVTANFQDVSFTQIEQPRVEEQLETEGQPEMEGQIKEKDRESVLDKINRTTGGITQRMSTFANQILNGGKEE